MERVDKILGNMGHGSRKELKQLIKKGNLMVNGRPIKDSGFKVDPYSDNIVYNGENIIYRKFIYIMMNKAAGLVSSTDDPLSETVIDVLEDEYKIFNPFPIGRLDKDTEGLLILSNDGQLAHNLLSPKKHVEKTYYARISGKVEEKHREDFKEGIVLDDGYKTLEAKLHILKSDDISEVNLTIQEGKYHQVKRMFESLNMKVIYLKRLSMGTLELDESLLIGEYRELKESELNILKSLV